jgi:3-hydroxyacyl-CoA dehydrogenase/enoyl-CoA hydratase/3-hydroxybutyryl-CoA epimerase
MPLFRSETINVDRDVDGSVHLVIDVPNHSVNVITRQVLTDLDAALDAIREAARTPVIFVRSGKKSGFLAGADIAAFQAISTAAEAEALSAAGQKVFGKLADLPVPTVAAISGPCLGGGLELALACDYRLVFDHSRTQLGLPEVELGLLPAWGGTQRLPRTVGLERGLTLILTARRLTAREALAWGLADALAATEAALREQYSALAFRAIRDGKRPHRRLPLRTWKQKFFEASGIGRRLVMRAVRRNLQHRVPDDMPAPFEVLEAVRVGLQQGIEAGLASERTAAGRLATTPACRNLVGLFLATRQAEKLPEEIGAEAAEVRKVGVVGAGVMGAGIIQLAALRGCDVIVKEVNEAALHAGQARVEELIRKAIERQVVPEAHARQRQSAIRWSLNWDEFNDTDVVVEAAIEDLELKKQLFRDMAARCGPRAILATNTSSLSVTALQEGLAEPARVAGMHFFNPVHRIPLVEVVRGPNTSPATLATLAQFAVRLGKVPVLVGDGPGFVVNRVLMPYLNEAVLLAASGMPIAAVDRVMRRFGMQMGPLEVLDQIGLDVAAHVARSMAPVMSDRFPPHPAFEKMRAAGLLGLKSGKGFYLHKNKKRTVNPEAEQLLREISDPVAAAMPWAARLAEARERMVLLMVNEAALVVSEGLANSATVNLALVLGTGWAPHRGGPLRYANDRGLGDVVQALTNLAARHGRRFEPCSELRRRAEANEALV